MYKNKKVRDTVKNLNFAYRVPNEYSFLLRAYNMTECATVTNELIFDRLETSDTTTIENLMLLLLKCNVKRFGVYIVNEGLYSTIVSLVQASGFTIVGEKNVHILKPLTGDLILVPATMFESVH